MAASNEIIFNQRTGQLIKFIKTSSNTDGALLEINATFYRKSEAPALHYHPFQTENFRVISGELTVNIDNRIVVLKEGDTLCIPPNSVHAMWNSSLQKTIVNWQVRPALKTEYFLKTITGLANDNKTNAKGVPCIWQMVLTAHKYNQILRLNKPSFFIQKILFTLLAPVARLLGYKADYDKYFN